MRTRKNSQQGVSLITTLVLCGVIGAILVSHLFWAASHRTVCARSFAWDSALPVAEAGVEEALTQLKFNGTNRASDGWNYQLPLYIKTRTMPGSNAYYQTTITTNLQSPVIVSRGYVQAPLRTDQYLVRTVQVTTTNRPLFNLGLAAKLTIDMRGNNISVDSYDSSDPNYSVNGQWSPTKIKDGGDIGTIMGLVDSVSVGNANIWGHVFTGPGGTVSVGSQGAVGSTAWQTAGNSGIQPGWSSSDLELEFPPIDDCPKSGGFPPGGKVAGTSYQAILGNGTYDVSDITGSILVAGDATLIVRNKFQISGSDRIVMTPGATLKIYCYAASASIGGKGLANADLKPASFQYYGMPSNKSLSFSGGSSFVGVVYAPDTDFKCGGGGGTQMDFVGAAMVNSLSLNGKYSVHYDEALKKLKSAGYVVTSWKEL